MAELNTKILLLNGTQGEWSQLADYKLSRGEPAIEFIPTVGSESTTLESVKVKIGDGFTTYANLPYVGQETAEAVLALVERVKALEEAGYQDADDVSGSITEALKDYYTKNDVDGKFSSSTNVSVFNNDAKYQTETQVTTAIQAAISGINHAVFEKVDSVPAVEAAADNVLYLVPNGDKLDIYAKISGEMVLVDDTDTSLDGYATEDYVDGKIADLSKDGGAIKAVADELALLEEAHNGLADDVAKLEEIDHDKIAKDAADAAVEAHITAVAHLTTTDVDGQIDAKITAHNSDKDHFTAEEIATQVDDILTDKDYEGQIADAKQAAMDAAFIKSVDEDQFTVTDGKLTLDAIAQDKVTGLAEALAGIYTKEEVDNALDTKLEGVSVNGVALAVANNIVDIPAATAEKFGVVKLGSEFETAEDGALEVKELNVNKLVQTDGDVLVLNGGLASNLING